MAVWRHGGTAVVTIRLALKSDSLTVGQTIESDLQSRICILQSEISRPLLPFDLSSHHQPFQQPVMHQRISGNDGTVLDNIV